MSQKSKEVEQLRDQIETAAGKEYSYEAVEMKIAASLVNEGAYNGQIDEKDLTSIIRNVVYSRFADQRFGGRDLNLVHNIPAIKVKVSKQEVLVSFLVHIHRPIVAFLRFRYVLANDPLSDSKRIRLKRGTLSIRKDTRRFDIKAKAALATIDVERIARDELTDLATILRTTLSSQLNGYGISGEISEIQLKIGDNALDIYLEGDCRLVESPMTST